MPSEARHAKDFFTCCVANEMSANLKLALHSDSMATMVKYLLSPFAKILLTLGTKVLVDVNTRRYLCSIIVLGPSKQALDDILGHKRNTQNSRNLGLLIVWKGLRTFFLGLAQWTQEFHRHESDAE